MIGLFIISIYASLLGPVAAIGGAISGFLFWARRYNLLCAALAVTVVALGFRSASASPEGHLGTHIYFVATHSCAMVLWAIFTIALSKLLPQELPGGRRMWLRERAGLDRPRAGG